MQIVPESRFLYYWCCYLLFPPLHIPSFPSSIHVENSTHFGSSLAGKPSSHLPCVWWSSFEAMRWVKTSSRISCEVANVVRTRKCEFALLLNCHKLLSDDRTCAWKCNNLLSNRKVNYSNALPQFLSVGSRDRIASNAVPSKHERRCWNFFTFVMSSFVPTTVLNMA